MVTGWMVDEHFSTIQCAARLDELGILRPIPLCVTASPALAEWATEH